jgi:hypothetical protein
MKYYKLGGGLGEGHCCQDNETINNNIESYCSESLLRYEYNQQELKHYLIRIVDIVQEDSLKQAACQLLVKVSTF